MAILGRIASVSISSLDSEIVLIPSCAGPVAKCSEVVGPSWVNGDSAPAVIREGLAIGIVASFFDVGPNLIKSRPTLAVRSRVKKSRSLRLNHRGPDLSKGAQP